MIADQYPCESWIHVYTDGSATDAVANGGAGVYASFPEGHTTTTKIPTGKRCSNYSGEIQPSCRLHSFFRTPPANVFRRSSSQMHSQLWRPSQGENVHTSWRNSTTSNNKGEWYCSGYLPTVGYPEMRRQTSSPNSEHR
ncbi:hypothetical protein V1264_005893 [Littorina saxatilis]|uniref:RNase H type-1 domain-containing protein n=1 Tax=Littorina saxatilis TaxID=31220 RepID=A0AAN9G6D8_9CAEN